MTISIRKLHLAIVVLAVALIAPTTAMATHVFDDVADDEFYADPVEWAFDNGVTTGKSPTSFDPLGAVTRGESVTFLHRYDTNIVQPALAASVPAFHAAVSADPVPVPGTIVFDEETLDVGDDYDATTGVFTAPVDGVYQLSFVTVYDGSAGVIQMVKNGDTAAPLGSAWSKVGVSDAVFEDEDISASIIVTVHLEAGDAVTVTTASGSTDLFGTTGNGPFTYFSGHLIQAT